MTLAIVGNKFFWLGFIIFATLAILLYFLRTLKIRKLTRKILHSLALERLDTTIFVNPFSQKITIKNYKLSIEKTPFIATLLRDESENTLSYFAKKSFGSLVLTRIRKPQKSGIWQQSLIDGTVKKFNLEEKLKNTPALLLIGRSGSGKTVFVKSLLKQLTGEKHFFSPKYDFDIKPNREDSVFVYAYNEEMQNTIESLIAKKDEYKEPVYIIIDEIISLSDKKHKILWQKINECLSICRSTRLRILLLGQRIDRSSTELQIGLIDLMLLNIKDASLFAKSIGAEVTLQNLGVGEFALVENGIESAVYNILNQKEGETGEKGETQSLGRLDLKGKTTKAASERETKSERERPEELVSEKSGPIESEKEICQNDTKETKLKGKKNRINATNTYPINRHKNKDRFHG